jgi:hypothetical protein
MKRRDFVAGAISIAAVSRVAAQTTGASQRLAIYSLSEPSELMNERSDNRYYRALFAELRRLGHVEGQNFVIERPAPFVIRELYTAAQAQDLASWSGSQGVWDGSFVPPLSEHPSADECGQAGGHSKGVITNSRARHTQHGMRQIGGGEGYNARPDKNGTSKG